MAATVPASRTTSLRRSSDADSSYPTRPETPAPAVPAQEPTLHLLGGIWIASCPTCGYQLTTARTQERCERRARLPDLPHL
jgi:hypothetical protein